MLHPLLDLVLPRRCDGCGLSGTFLCSSCEHVLAASRPSQVRPEPCPPDLPRVVAAGSYDGVLRGLLLAHKERGRLRLSAPLGRALAAGVHLFGPDSMLLCPVPSSARAVRARGYDHTARLARATADAGGPGLTVRHLLVPGRRVQDQSGLSSEQRAANLKGALLACREPAGPVVIVDDVVTTGATLAEATRALSMVGHDVRGCLVVAATRRSR